MSDKHIYADVDLPFHVWVRERAPGGHFRWVLREAPQARQHGSGPRAGTAGAPSPRVAG